MFLYGVIIGSLVVVCRYDLLLRAYDSPFLSFPCFFPSRYGHFISFTEGWRNNSVFAWYLAVVCTLAAYGGLVLLIRLGLIHIKKVWLAKKHAYQHDPAQ